MTEIIATIVHVGDEQGCNPHIVTRVLRFEFESLEAAENFLDTSDDINGLVNAELLGAVVTNPR